MFRGSHESRALLAAMKNQLSLTLKKRELSHLVRNKTTPSYSSIVSCSNCEGFMVQPVCMPCGHSVCKGCTEKSTMLNKENLICPKCNHSCPQIPAGFNATSSKQMSGEGEEGFGHGERESSAGQHRMPTLTIQNAFRKWYPKWAESCRCREEGNKHANQGDYTSAIHWYTKALNAGMCVCICLCVCTYLYLCIYIYVLYLCTVCVWIHLQIKDIHSVEAYIIILHEAYIIN